MVCTFACIKKTSVEQYWDNHLHKIYSNKHLDYSDIVNEKKYVYS